MKVYIVLCSIDVPYGCFTRVAATFINKDDAIEYTTDQDLNTDRFTSYDYVESELQEEYTPRRERSGAV